MSRETFTHKGQIYRVTMIEVRAGKRDLVHFESECAECGVTFAGKQLRPVKWPTKRCAEHKAPGLKAVACE